MKTFSRGGKRRKLTITEAYLKCPTMIPGQQWVGAKSRYFFECVRHGRYSRVWSSQFAGYGCRECALEKMRSRWDLTGQRFGFRVVISYAGKKAGYRNALLWNCRCDCGTESVVSGGALRSGKSQQCLTCGHLATHRKNRLPDGQAAKNAMLRQAKNQAKYRKLVWELSDEEWERLTQSLCFYCGTPPLQRAKRYRGVFIYNGIDRVKNNQGYTVENSVPCCWICNRMKQALAVEQFIIHVKKIVQYLEKQK